VIQKLKTQELKTKIWNVQNQCENRYLLCQCMHTWTWKEHNKSYGTRLCLKLTLTKLKEMKDPTPIYTSLGI
jgi:hypothetical protein